jgi:hypothetical protein
MNPVRQVLFEIYSVFYNRYGTDVNCGEQFGCVRRVKDDEFRIRRRFPWTRDNVHGVLSLIE